MISKLLNYHRNISLIVTRVILAEIVQMIIFSIVSTLAMLMISHLLISGELGICYWSLKRGWIWN